MASIYVDLKELASELLTADDDNFGQSTDAHPISILVRTEAAGATDLDKPTVTWTATQVKAASHGVSEKRDGAALYAMADKIVRIEADGNTAPRLQDKIRIGTVEYAIVDVEPVPNGPIPAAYRVAVKR